MAEINSYITGFKDALRRYLHRKHTVNALWGAQVALLVSLLVFVAAAVAEGAARFGTAERTILFALWLLISGAAAFHFAVRHIAARLKRLSDEAAVRAALEAGARFPEVKDTVANALQLAAGAGGGAGQDAFVAAAIRQAWQQAGGVRFAAAITMERPRRLLRVTLTAVLLSAAAFSSWGWLADAGARLLRHNTVFRVPQKFYLTVTPSAERVNRGDDVLVTVAAEGAAPTQITLFSKDESMSSFSGRQLSSDSSGRFWFTVRNIRTATQLYAEAEGISSPVCTVAVITRPVIESFSVTISPPAYTNLPPVTVQDNGSITALYGSTVFIRLAATKPLGAAGIAADSGSVTPLAVKGRSAEGGFTVRQNSTYSLRVTDTDGFTNSGPVQYSVTVTPDAPPQVAMLLPGKDMNLTGDERVPLALRISDDYGFTRLLLHYRLSASRYEAEQKEFSTLAIPVIPREKEQLVEYIWNLSPLHLATEDVVTYYLEVFDNDNISGPKSAKTQLYAIRVPSLDELYTRADEEQQQVQQEMMQALKEADELKREMEKISRDLKQDKKDITWEEKEKLEKTAQKFEQLQQKVDNLSQKLDESKRELQQNNLLSKETMEKYMELQNLFEQMSSEEMKKAMEKLQNSLQNMDRKQLQDALQNMKFDEEQFRQSLERTLNLLKRIQAEQKAGELQKRARELEQQQQQLADEAASQPNPQPQQQDELARRQDALDNSLRRMEQEMKQLQELMQSMQDMPNADMQKLAEEFDKQENRELNKDAAQNMQQGKMRQAQQQQARLAQNMKRMQEGLQQLQSAMQQQTQMQAFLDMMKMLENTLALSKKQEELLDKFREQGGSPSSEDTRKQDGLKRGIDKLLNQMGGLSQKTFAITPEMGRALGEAKRKMDMALDAMENRNGSMASMNQGDAMANLNKAAAMMKGSMDQMMQGGGQGGMMSLMQQLGQLSGQQMGLNNLTQQLQQGLQNGGLSPQQQAELQRLAQQQDLIRKSLDQLRDEAENSGKSKTLPQNLQDILRQMQEVVTDMKTQSLDDELVQKQEKILSKLLDAQRSVNERDYERERESFTGSNVTRKSPPGITPDKPGNNPAKDELDRAVQEGYSRDYLDLIRRYYEALRSAGIRR